jgi:hypothetical protein
MVIILSKKFFISLILCQFRPHGLYLNIVYVSLVSHPQIPYSDHPKQYYLKSTCYEIPLPNFLPSPRASACSGSILSVFSRAWILASVFYWEWQTKAKDQQTELHIVVFFHFHVFNIFLDKEYLPFQYYNRKNCHNSVVFSPQANYIDRAIAAGQRS